MKMFKGVIIIILIGLIMLLGTSLFFFREKSAGPDNLETYIDEKRLIIKDAFIIAEIADEAHEQVQGLSGREELGDDRGMLFIFPQPIAPSFWMKEMKFALDIIWINEGKIIAGINKNVSPDTFPQTFLPPSPIKYVLEVSAGWTDKNNIKIGDRMKGL